MNLPSEPFELYDPPIWGTITKPITPLHRGRVAAFASIWYCSFYHPDYYVSLEPGDSVLIVGRRGITLLIIPTAPEDYIASFQTHTPPDSLPFTISGDQLLSRLFIFIFLIVISFNFLRQLPGDLTIASYHSLLISKLLTDLWATATQSLRR